MWMVDWLFLELVAWVLPVTSGVLSCAYAAYSLRRREAISTVMSCYVLSSVVVLFGVLGTWRSGLAVWEVLGVAGDISAELLYDGWKRSWWSLSISGLSAAALLGIATAAMLNPPRNLPTTPKAELAVAMVYPAAAVTFLVVMGIAVEETVGLSLLPPYDFSPQAQLAIKLMATALLGYYLLAFLGIPYLIVWGVQLMRWRRSTSDGGRRKVVTVFYFVFGLLTLVYSALFFLSALWGHNPFLPGSGQ